MTRTKRILSWGLLLWKRLYKKITFLLLLAMIPALVFSYGIVSQEDSGVVAVALATETGAVDELTRRIWDDLQESGPIRYVECSDPQQARDMVDAGEVDTAWIFAPDLEARIYDFVAKRVSSRAFITVVEPKDRTLLRLLREVLSGTVFPYCTETLYLQYIRENASELDHVSDEKLLEYYQGANLSDGLFVATDIHGNQLEVPEAAKNYLMAPVRGMLAVVVVLAGLATAMYYIRDEENGTFAWMSQRRKPLMELGCQLISIVNVLAVVVLSLAVTKQTLHWSRELLVSVMYTFCVAAFAMLVRRLSGGIRGLGMVTPLLVVVMLVVCPVFFDLGMLWRLQLLFPPTYFVTAAYEDRYLWFVLLYTVICLVASRVFDYLRHADR